MADTPLFGPDWLENVNIARKPRFKNGKPMLCLPELSEENCCGYIDLIQWLWRTRSTEKGCYQVWEGKFVPEYVNTYFGALQYYGQHPLEEECRGVYYVANHATGAMDAFKRNFANGLTIDQLWTAPLGSLPHFTAARAIAKGDTRVETDGIMCLQGPIDGCMSFIDFNDMICFVGYDDDQIHFFLDGATGELTCQIELGTSYLQVRDKTTGAIIKEGPVSYTESGVYAFNECSQAFFNAVTYGAYCGVGRNIVSAVALDDNEVFVSHQGGIVPRPGCAKPDPASPLQYEWARQGGKVRLAFSDTFGWVDIEHEKEDAPVGNAFLDNAAIHHTLRSDESCLPEPPDHVEPSHSACLNANAPPARIYVGQIHAGANKLSTSYITGGDYAVGSEDGSLLVVRGLPAGEVFTPLACAPTDFAYVLQETLEGGDTEDDREKCKAVWGDPGDPPSCNEYLGDARYTITAYDYCACAMELVVDLCAGPCKPFAAFDWYLCLKQDCDYTEGVCTRGPVDCFTQLCSPVGKGSALCGEPFWVPMVNVPTTLVLMGRDGCGCSFRVCKLVDAQATCDCPIELLVGVNPPCAFSDHVGDLTLACSAEYPPNDFESCGTGIPETACSAVQSLWAVHFRTPCLNTRLYINGWAWFGTNAGGEWCEAAQEVPYICFDPATEGNPYNITSAFRCGHYWTDPDCTGDFYEVGWDVSVTAVNLDTGASCQESFRIVLATGGTPP